MQKANVTLKGKLDSVRRVRTRTETSMVTFSVAETPCKAFGGNAEVLLGWAPGNLVELHGYYETRSQRFGREFLAVRGRLLRKENSASAVSVSEEKRTIDKRETSQVSVPSPSAPIEPIPAKVPIGVKTDLTAVKPSAPRSCMPSARAPRPADESVRVKPVTFEDLENQYKSQKAARELEKPNQQANRPSDQTA
jgi:hypothetical protein